MIVQQALLNTPLHASSRKAGRVAFPSVETPAERIAATPTTGGMSRSKSTGDFLATPRMVDWGVPPTPGMGRSQSTGNNRPSVRRFSICLPSFSLLTKDVNSSRNSSRRLRPASASLRR